MPYSQNKTVFSPLILSARVRPQTNSKTLLKRIKIKNMTVQELWKQTHPIDLGIVTSEDAMKFAEKYAADYTHELREALDTLMDWQNGPPLATYEKQWRAAMDKAQKLLDRTA